MNVKRLAIGSLAGLAVVWGAFFFAASMDVDTISMAVGIVVGTTATTIANIIAKEL